MSAPALPERAEDAAPAPPAAAALERRPAPEQPAQGGRRRPLLGRAPRSARTSILLSYVLLLAVSTAVTAFAIHEVLHIRLVDEVNDALEQEILEFDRLLIDGRDPQTGEPFASLRALFDVYISRNVPAEDEAMLAFVDGELQAAQLARYPLDQIPQPALTQWEALSSRSPAAEGSSTGTFDTSVGKAHFRAIRIVFREDVGAFVVTTLPQGERQEIAEVQWFSIGATLGLLALASALAWLIAGKVLAPLPQLTETARSISQSNLARRIAVRGVGEAAEMARSFNAMLDRLEATFRSHREFVQDASHELRDPLTICRGHLELLGEEDDPQEQRATIDLVLDEIDRMGRIVDDLQVLAEAEQGGFLRLEPIELAPFAHELLAKATALGPRTWELDHAVDGVVVADGHRLTEAVMNLVHNAVNHTEREDTIAIGADASDHDVSIWVRDTGVGVALSDQTRIFERFTRGRGAHRRYRGGGLGLAIVKAIAEAHGGDVRLESRLGVGSTFTIVVPRDGPGREDDGESLDR